MGYDMLRKELRAFYDALEEEAFEFNRICSEELENLVTDDMSAYRAKAEVYRVIGRRSRPHVFRNVSFFYEPACMSATTQGEGENDRAPLAKLHPGGWLYRRNRHLFQDADPELFEASRVPFYSWCGEYGDFRYHFSFNIQKVLTGGLASLDQKAEEALQTTHDEEEREFLKAMREGLRACRTITEKFADEAERMLPAAENDEERKRLCRIADAARRTPWEAPHNFYEALNTIALMGKLVGTLEGVNNTDMGRLDVLLLPFYEKDLAEGRMSREEARGLITEFLLIWECHVDHDVKHEGTHNYESMVYTLGGCDREGHPVYNELTKFFLEAHIRENLIFPKRKCRFSEKSPKEYLDLIDREVLDGRTTVLYLNDNALVPAFERMGFSEEEARNYTMLGCWEPVLPGCTNEHCGYVNLIGIFEASLYGDFAHPEIRLESFENAPDFENVYEITLKNLLTVLEHKCRAAYRGRATWPQVDPLPLISSALDDCIATGRDYTAGGARHKVDELVCAGLVNVVNSLLAIREVCFGTDPVPLPEFCRAVRNNWEGEERLRARALAAPYWGDEGADTSAFMNRILTDLYTGTRGFPVLYGGKISLGYMLYLELYGWAERLRATPDGRKNGDTFERGLTPSVLHPVKSITRVVNSMRAVDPTVIGADSVLNINLSLKSGDEAALEALLRVMAGTGIQALQLNCVTRAELEAAMEDPERYRDIVVRVCGYSARFTGLSPMIRREFLARNFMD